MKEKTPQEWHEYLGAYDITDSFQQSDEYKQIKELEERIRPYYSLLHGDLRKINCAKRIVKEPIKKFPGYEKYPPYCFRFQCLQTGRLSRYIKIEDWPYYGITPIEARTGGDYPSPQKMDNKIDPLFRSYREAFLKAWESFREYQQEALESFNWMNRYNEYLNSEAWHNKRQRVLKYDMFTCLATGETENLQVHHIHYMNIGIEPMCDLLTLSRDAHNYIHSLVNEPIKRREYELSCIKERSRNHGLLYSEEWAACWSHNPYWVDEFSNMEA